MKRAEMGRKRLKISHNNLLYKELPPRRERICSMSMGMDISARMVTLAVLRQILV